MASPKTQPKMGVNKFDAQMAALAQQAATAEESALGGGSFISTKGGRLSFGGQYIEGDKMNVVIIDSVMDNHYYTEKYDPDNPASPVCFAFGRDDKSMAPHAAAPEPQNDKCATCPMNQFGSADVGKGKACQNTRRLALIPEGALKNIDEAEVAFMKIPVMSVKNYAGYVTELSSALKRPPLGVITEIKLVPDDKSQFRVQFKLVREIKDGAQLNDLLAKFEKVRETIGFPYQQVEREEPKGRGGKKPAAKKPAPAAKKTAGAAKYSRR